MGLASGLRDEVRGGGAGGVRLCATRARSSELRSGTGGLPNGGLVSVSEPLGYECKRLRLYDPLGYRLEGLMVLALGLRRVCELSSEVESSGRI